MASLEQYKAIFAQANDLLAEHGLADEWHFELSRHKHIMGQCDPNRKAIKFSEYFLDSPSWKVTDTLLHEIAHALAGCEHGHDAVWKAMCLTIGADPTRTYDAADVVNKARPNYLVRCTSCGREWKRYRLRKSLLRDSARSVCCGAPLEAFKLTYKRGVI